MSDIHVIAGELQGLTETLREIEVDAETKIRKVMHLIGIRTIEYLRDLIDETQPPIRPGEPARQARRGHWADNTGNLARAYDYEVSELAGAITLTLSNHMEYAAALDTKEGYFVLRGVTDKGGPVEQMLIRAVREIAPDWEVRYE